MGHTIQPDQCNILFRGHAVSPLDRPRCQHVSNDLTPQCGGLFAISLGLSANFPEDHEMLDYGMVMYDALYTWCRSLQAETHGWPPR
jgi:hypothetical protein